MFHLTGSGNMASKRVSKRELAANRAPTIPQTSFVAKLIHECAQRVRDTFEIRFAGGSWREWTARQGWARDENDFRLATFALENAAEKFSLKEERGMVFLFFFFFFFFFFLLPRSILDRFRQLCLPLVSIVKKWIPSSKNGSNQALCNRRNDYAKS